ncbi:HupE/UreJ family protein [Rhodoferax sp.]|jgi:urease accessory protein|uniref:HupE/UreJ family protein n=1 Tax=Rhodoferax sp. TaxID=50421 RepID=UPI003783E3C4
MTGHARWMLLGLLCAAGSVAAHTVHTGLGGDSTPHTHALDSLLQGMLHPITGLDHVAAMLAVGCWSALTARRVWVAPLAFANVLLAGALLGMAGVALPAVEPMVASSLLVLGLLLASRTRMQGAASALLVGGFAAFHGWAHGSELSGALWFAPLAGMVLATLALHTLGVALGLALRGRSLWWSRMAGAMVALAGAALLVRAV